jgi:hypothetical protein
MLWQPRFGGDISAFLGTDLKADSVEKKVGLD